MKTKKEDGSDSSYSFDSWFVLRCVLLVVLWLVCLSYAGQRLWRARTEFDNRADEPVEKHRADGNSGHTQIDFGGQWVLGRMLVEGHGRELYNRNRQWQIVWAAYPVEDESPYVRRNAFPRQFRERDAWGEEVRHDAESMMDWFMGRDSPRWSEAGAAATLPFANGAISANPFATAALTAIAAEQLTPELVDDVNQRRTGGPLYPPIHAFVYAPIGLIDRPRDGYFVFQVLSVALTFVAGLGITRLSRGRIWWPVATTAILLFPGYRSGLDLAQNQVVTLTLLVWGWVFAARGREGWGGVMWGLLAFKPVWAVAFLLVPVLMGRWRFMYAMCLTGASLIGVTIPVVGVQAWLDWLSNGREASGLYSVNQNWIGLSRDLSGIVHRLMVDFKLSEAERGNVWADRLAWVFWFAVFVPTVAIYFWRADRRYRTGLGAAFLTLGAYLCCYRYMYYDVLLAVLPLAMLFADPGRFLRGPVFDFRVATNPGVSETLPTPTAPNGSHWVGYLNSFAATILVALYLAENWLMHFGIEASVVFGFLASPKAPKLSAEVNLFHAWDTLLLLALWAWCGYRLVVGKDWGEPTT